jgi:hypothetical protein
VRDFFFFFEIGSGLASNHDPPDFCLLNRCESPAPS